jgi:transcriptional regulator with XRE-family HTH domain
VKGLAVSLRDGETAETRIIGTATRMVHAMTFGEKMLALMRERGIGLRALARAIPINPGYLSKISRDLCPLSEEMAARIDKALDAGGALAALRPPTVRERLNGHFTPDDEERIAYVMRRPSRIDSQAVDSLTTILAEQRRLEDSIGSDPVLRAVKAQLRTIDHLVAEAHGPVRGKLVDVAAQWAQFAGWLNIAVDDARGARASLDRAAEYADEVGDVDMIGTVLSWKGYLAELRGEVGSMVGLSAAAQRGRRGPGRVYDVFQEARGHALAGDASRASRLLDEAQQGAADADAADAREWEYYYLSPGFFDLVVGLTRVYLGRNDPGENARAVEALAAGLSALPTEMRRSEWAGEFIGHQATAHMQQGEAEAACSAIAEAADIARATSSKALLRKLRSIHGGMRARWPDDSGVAELRDALR